MGWKAKKNVIYEQKFQKTLYDKAWVWEIKLWMVAEAESEGRAQVQDWVQSIFAFEEARNCFNGIHELFKATHNGLCTKGLGEVVKDQHYTWDVCGN